MNEQMFRAMNLKFVKKKRGRTFSNADVCISRNEKKFVLAFRIDVANKLGTHVKIAISAKRIYVIPSSSNDPIAYAVSRKKNNGRPTVSISYSALSDQDIDINELSRFDGEHDLKFWDDLDAYFISINDIDNEEGDDQE